MNIETLQFDGLFVIENFLNWLAEVERFFEYWRTEEEKRVELVTYRLKGGPLTLWDQLQTSHIRQGKNKI